MANGSNYVRILWAVCSTLAAVVLGLVSGWAFEQRAMDRDLIAADRNLEQRVALLEREYAVLHQQYNQIDKKLDILLDTKKGKEKE